MKILPEINDFKYILRMAVPAIAGLSTQMIVSLIDTAMVGRLENAELSLAAMGIGVLATWAIVSFFSSLATGTHVLTAKNFGSKNYDNCASILNTSIIMNLFIGTIMASIIVVFAEAIAQFFAADALVGKEAGKYLFFRFMGLPFFLITVAFRGFYFGIGRTKIFMYSGILVNTLNVILNYIFIYGEFGLEPMGLAGAAVGSTLATIGDVIFYVFVSKQKDISSKFNLVKNFSINTDFIKQITKISFPVSFQNISILVGFLSFMSIIGLIGIKEQAVSQLVFSALLISLLPGLGFGIATQTLFGNNLGAGKIKKAKTYVYGTIKIATIYNLILFIIFYFLPEVILVLITDDKNLISSATPIMKIAGIGQIFYAAGVVLANALQVAGFSIFVMISDVISNLIIFVPIAYLLGIVLKLGYDYAWSVLPLYTFLYSLINLWKFKKHEDDFPQFIRKK